VPRASDPSQTPNRLLHIWLQDAKDTPQDPANHREGPASVGEQVAEVGEAIRPAALPVASRKAASVGSLSNEIRAITAFKETMPDAVGL
jgi:hypothetical protein